MLSFVGHQGLVNDLMLGKAASVGAVEALLLLSGV